MVWTRLNESRGLPEAAGVERVVQLDHTHPDTIEALQVPVNIPAPRATRHREVQGDPLLTPRDVIESHQLFQAYEATDEAFDLLYGFVKRHALALTLEAVSSEIADDFFQVVKAVPDDECADLGTPVPYHALHNSSYARFLAHRLCVLQRWQTVNCNADGAASTPVTQWYNPLSAQRREHKLQ